MKVIIAGSRTINSITLVEQAIEESGFIITEVIEGEANGVDKLAKIWAKANNIPVTSFQAIWDDLETEPLFIKTNRYGKKYNSLAGFNRNQDMANYGEALIAIRQNMSHGTTDMIERAKKAGLKVFIKEVK